MFLAILVQPEKSWDWWRHTGVLPIEIVYVYIFIFCNFITHLVIYKKFGVVKQ